MVRYTQVSGIVCGTRFEDIPSLLTSIYLHTGSNELFTSRGRHGDGIVYIVAVHRVYYIIIVIILLSVRSPSPPKASGLLE